MKFFVFSILMFVSLMGGCQSQNDRNVPSANAVANTPPKPASVTNVNSNEFTTLQQKGAIVIDVRTPDEIAAGYIDGTTVFADIYGPDFNDKINALDKSKTYLIYCRSGRRSLSAAQMMVDNGFQNVYNLTSGITGWSGPIKK